MKYPLFSILAIAALSVPALAATDIKNISTGYDDVNNVQLGDLAIDADWTIAPGSVTGVGGPLSTIISDVPGPYIPDNDSSASRWIGLYTGTGISVPAGNYIFSTAVNIDGSIGNTSTVGFAALRFAADDKVRDISINGTSIYSATCECPDYDDWIKLDCVGAGLFVTGNNVITFLVENGDSDPLNPMGLRVEGTVALDACKTGVNPPVPEPATAGMLGLATLALMARFRRKSV